MKELETKFFGRGSQKGFDFELIERNGNIALYKKFTAVDIYEVIIIQEQNEQETTIGGNLVKFEHKERYPSDEDFGTLGWCYNSLERAKNKYDRLIKNRDENID